MSAVDHRSGHLTVEVVDPLICHDPQVVFYGVKQIVRGEYPDWGASSEPFAVDEFMKSTSCESTAAAVRALRPAVRPDTARWPSPLR